MEKSSAELREAVLAKIAERKLAWSKFLATNYSSKIDGDFVLQEFENLEFSIGEIFDETEPGVTTVSHAITQVKQKNKHRVKKGDNVLLWNGEQGIVEEVCNRAWHIKLCGSHFHVANIKTINGVTINFGEDVYI